MSQDKHCGCGCGHDHDHNHQTPKSATPAEVTENQLAFLRQLGQRHYLPVARFTLADSRENDFFSTALAPVFLNAVDDEMETVKATGTFLQTLEDMGLLTLDYDMPLDGYDYERYKESALYRYFCDTVAEGASNLNFLGDTPLLELGSMALTAAGEQLVAANVL